MKTLHFAKSIALASLGIVVLFTCKAQGVDRNWKGAGTPNNDWAIAANWDTNDKAPSGSDNLFLNNNLVELPELMSITADNIGAKNITFSNGFNGKNTTVIGNSSTTKDRKLELASGGSITNNADFGIVTFQPKVAGGTKSLELELKGTTTFTVTNANASMEIATEIKGKDGAVIKVGSGVLTFTGANTYDGTTTINAGTLLVNGDHSKAKGAVTVNAGGTLGGSGKLGSPVTVDAGGTIRGGATNTTGTLFMDKNKSVTVNGGPGGTGATFAVDFAGGVANSKLELENTGNSNLNFVTTGGAFVIHLLNDTGLTENTPYSITIATAKSGNIQKNDVAWNAVSNPFTLGADYTLSSDAFGTFSDVSLTVVGGTNLQLNFTPGTITPVPEPATVLGIAAGALGLGGLVRRRLRGQLVPA